MQILVIQFANETRRDRIKWRHNEEDSLDITRMHFSPGSAVEIEGSFRDWNTFDLCYLRILHQLTWMSRNEQSFEQSNFFNHVQLGRVIEPAVPSDPTRWRNTQNGYPIFLIIDWKNRQIIFRLKWSRWLIHAQEHHFSLKIILFITVTLKLWTIWVGYIDSSTKREFAFLQ